MLNPFLQAGYALPCFLKYMINSELEITINRALNKFGDTLLIRFINDIDKKFNFYPGLEFEFIETIVFQYFSVKYSEVYNSNSTGTSIVNCKKMLAFMLLKHTDIGNDGICYLVDISDRTLRRYKKNLFSVIEMPETDPDLHRAYKYLNEKLTNNN